MRLLEAIVEANHRALAGDKSAGLRPEEFKNSLPLAALTCIDARLNALMPEVLGIPEEQFIWLRNAGNIIFGPTSSMTRSLALACLVKGGKEIAIIGHTDCKVRQTSIADLTDKFRALGIERSRLPDNLNEFFGLFASERQNVIRAVDFVRESPIIGPKIPVHGLLVDIETAKLEWVVNGYEVLERTGQTVMPTLGSERSLDNLAAFRFGEMKFPDLKIGEVSATAAPVSEVKPQASPKVPVVPDLKALKQELIRFNKTALFKIVGNDKKVYGPVSGEMIEEWLADERIKLTSLAQKVGYKDWKPLAHFAESSVASSRPLRMK